MSFGELFSKVLEPTTSVLCVYSLLFMQFALQVQPRNLMLFTCHLSNEAVQLYQFNRWWQQDSTKTADAAASTCTEEKN